MHERHDEQRAALRTATGGAVAAYAGDAQQFRASVPLDGWSPLWTGLARLGGVLPPAGDPHKDPWSLLRGWKHPPGGGSADGRLVGRAGGAARDAGFRFDAPVSPGGYAWWYVDAISDDGTHGLTIIAFLGSVFSPYYKASGRGDPIDHSALNIALYGPRARWCMTERGRDRVSREGCAMTMGPSAVRWTGDALVIDIEERDKRLGIPWQRRVRGQVIVRPETLNVRPFELDPQGRHIWHCLAPRARIEVRMDEPSVCWQGSAYVDSNRGEESLEEGFRVWHWSRAHCGREAAVFYEGVRREGSHFASAIRFDREGTPDEVELPLVAPLPNTVWQMERKTRADHGHAGVIRTWEDAPFYARSTLSTRLFGRPAIAVQESLDLDRFASPVVQFMLPYRMPRRV